MGARKTSGTDGRKNSGRRVHVVQFPHFQFMAQEGIVIPHSTFWAEAIFTLQFKNFRQLYDRMFEPKNLHLDFCFKHYRLISGFKICIIWPPKCLNSTKWPMMAKALAQTWTTFFRSDERSENIHSFENIHTMAEQRFNKVAHTLTNRTRNTWQYQRIILALCRWFKQFTKHSGLFGKPP